MLENNLISFPENLLFPIKSYERVPITIYEDSQDGSKKIALRIAEIIRSKQENNQHTVLGLATGSSPLKVYAELISIYKNEGLSFKNVYTFNLDEYYPINEDHPESYHYFMNEYLFRHIDIDLKNTFIPKGNIPLSQVKSHCQKYEEEIKSLGGLDFQLLGIGRTGHIGFNEPGSDDRTETRLVRIDNITRRDAASDFGGLQNVPYEAITMGVKTILSAKEIVIMAWGQHKADILREAVEQMVGPLVPATYLQNHNNVSFVLDKAAAGKLTRALTPWKVGVCNWDINLSCKAVVWLSQKIKKPILKLTDEDYNENGLSELILNEKNAYQLNIKIFNKLQHTITGWPGGKPNTDDSQRPERAMPVKKRVIIFSPHPDDDVISMGGTFLRLVEQGHEVHVAYQTSGSNAVHNSDVVRYLDFYEELAIHLSVNEKSNPLTKSMRETIRSGKITKGDYGLKKIKALIRRGEARDAARFCGLEDKGIHFMDMPFYEKGGIKNKSITEEDIQLTMDLMKSIKPHQVFAAGDLADPHGTHRVCLNAIIESFHRLISEDWMKDCWLWLYRGAWEDFKLDEIDMAIPLSPTELLKKRSAIFKHQSQKDHPPFPGEDSREFWQRSEDRNRNTARLFRELGFAEYEAMESFRRWKFH